MLSKKGEQSMVYATYRKALRAHGLKLRYDDGLKESIASKCYKDEKGRSAAIIVKKKKGRFRFLSLGQGAWKAYFDREIKVLEEALRNLGFSASSV